MKQVLFNSHIDLAKKKKNFSIDSTTEDKKCKTQVRKSFTYVVDRARDNRALSREPLVFIRKSFDTKKGIEEFSFHVKGHFHVTHEDVLVKVLFHHTLDIKIKWKVKVLSPNQSESLT